MRVYAVSDLHTDFKENIELLRSLSPTAHKRDVLLVAGDIADRIETIAETLSVLRARFRHVFYTPGNHELWVRSGGSDSLEKMRRVVALCDELGIQTRPGKAGALWIVPLFSWYDAGFDVDGSANAAELEGWADLYFCKWPERIGPISEYFLKLNTGRLRRYDGPVISLSHFLPRRDLLPPTTRLRFKGLPLVAGCIALDEQIRRLGSVAHVFGHSHINCDRVIEGVRYVQNALKYPNDRKTKTLSLKLIWKH
jgi:Calcineurin-like phosphoesterase